ncbi:TetR/AcrR family transcriptional regulator [Yoonia sp. SS1-5]|uniref:TetR/AcrR family transcriptional regulator n=1 Tax=Yoonia rhodophyticola TaxID=3137370 RepID=A0AAN0MA75_9RHOB
MNVFWTLGYDATTTDQLLQGMKLTRGSLYKAFGDKKQLFLKSLELYDQREVQEAVYALATPGTSGAERIRLLFSSIANAVEAGDHIGCLLCTTLSGPSATDPEIAASTSAQAQKLRDGFSIALKHDGDGKYPDSYADLLVTQYVGLRMLSRARVPVAIIRESVDAISQLLERPDQ